MKSDIRCVKSRTRELENRKSPRRHQEIEIMWTHTHTPPLFVLRGNITIGP